jgi:acyl-lipid omega-6 desaturase (Delta-12 desaturase)
MTDEEFSARREGRELHVATKPFTIESQSKSWRYTLTTFGLLLLTLCAAGFVPWWPARLGLSLLGGLLIVRAFVLYHDFMHGSFLGGSRVAKALFYGWGLVILTPPRFWRFSHNFHHANVGKPIPVKEGKFSLLSSDIGAVALMTSEMWRQATFAQRLTYRISRHPLTIVFAYWTVFLYSLCLSPLFANPRKYWDSALSIAAHVALIAVLYFAFDLSVVFFSMLLPFAVASAIGAYLFYAQHSFEGMKILPADQWTTFRAALESSSYLKMGPLMNWFTANIGYHHVHHLNSHIPFYRLPEAMAALPELQHPTTTTLRPRDIIKCFRMSLWDPAAECLVAFPHS